jgi:uncharacterized membrane protein
MTPARTIPLIGRTLLVLGGAYLLRALTDSALLPPVGGAAAGLVYAAWWLVQADRNAAAGPRQSATLFTVATSLALIFATHEFMTLAPTLLLAAVAVEMLLVTESSSPHAARPSVAGSSSCHRQSSGRRPSGASPA